MPMITEIIVISLLLLISILLFFILKRNSKPTFKKNVKFNEIFIILNSIIDNNKLRYTSGLVKIQKEFSILTSDGSGAPNDKMVSYVAAKEKLKIKWAKKIVGSLSDDLRKQFLVYFSSAGFINYILSELDKDE